MSQSPYLHDIPLDQAVRYFHDKLRSLKFLEPLGVDEIELSEEALGRVLAEPITARHCSPHYHASAMDGFAVRSSDTLGAIPAMPVILRTGPHLEYVDTGDPLPNWADAVIPIENVESLTQDGKLFEVDGLRTPYSIRIRASVSPWSYVRPVGEDLITGQLILAAGERLRPADLGSAAAGGISRLRVTKKPLIGILPTGDELVSLEKEPEKGEISEFNSIVLAAQIKEWGGQPHRYPITKDNLDKVKGMIQSAAEECDLVLVNAGSSAGREDFTAQAVEQLGEVIVHGIAVRPGHPVIIGFVTVMKNKASCSVPVIGVPGYPVSAAMTTEILVKPLINIWLGLTNLKQGEVQAILTRKITSTAGDDDYVRVILGNVNGRLLAAPISRGAGVTTSLSKADGILVIPRMIQGIEAGTRVSVRPYRDLSEINKNILTIGSHDMTLDILAQFLSKYNRRLVSSNSGSMGGLLALKKGENHFAGSHLLHPQSGTYNTVDIKRLLPNQRILVLSWVDREQGLMVKRGNPKSIRTLADLNREDVTFINRQRGAGTRVLLDYHLEKLGISADSIKGYAQEEYTHLGVAVAVTSGRADCGLGVAAAADAMDLDFIHLYDEDYELVFSGESANDALLQPIFSLSTDPAFKAAIKKLPGYNVVHMGETRVIDPTIGEV